MLDVLGALLSFTATYQFIRMRSSGWFFTILAATLNAILYYQHGIYADTSLEVFYAVTGGIGFYLWWSGDKKPRPQAQDDTRLSPIITQLSYRGYFLLLCLFSSIYFLLFFLLSRLTDSDIPALDALTTTLSLLGQGLMMFKVIHTWVIWLTTDSIYVYLYAVKQLPAHSILMVIYTGLAYVGYRQWKQTIIRSDTTLKIFPSTIESVNKLSNE